MGTSSILAGAVLAALLTAGGKKYDLQGLIHAVSFNAYLSTYHDKPVFRDVVRFCQLVTDQPNFEMSRPFSIFIYEENFTI